MAAAGEVLVRCLQMLAAKARAGVTTGELDAAAEKFIRSQGAEPAFKGYRGFPGSICASPNSMVVHGIPGPYELKRGDVLSIDVGVVKDGWVADAALTVPIGPIDPEARKLLDVTKASLFAGVEQMQARQPPRRRLRGDPARGRDRGPLDHPHPGRPRDRPRHARGPPGPQLRRARQGAAAGGGHGAGDRADGQRRRRRWCGWATTAGPSTPRTARWPPTSSSPSPSPPTARGSSLPGTREESSRPDGHQEPVDCG